MRVILQKPVDKLGVPGDVVQVADGYGRNYLIPRGLAIQATKGAVKATEGLRRAHDQRVAKARSEAEAVAAKIAASPIKVKARAGEEGKLFGSITSAELAEQIQRHSGEAIDRHDVHLDEPIRSVGVHEVKVHLHPEVNVALQIEVEAE